MQEIIHSLNNKPKLLLHACCAPCSSYVLEELVNYFDITIFYYNPNMNDLEEYNKRFDQFNILIKGMKLEDKVKIINGEYEQTTFYKFANSYANEKEGNTRCHLCYRLRLEETAKYAKNNNYDFFATTLTVSPYKNSDVINEIGNELERIYNISYLPSDFKKRNGYKRSIELSKKFNLYRQQFCGCIYSKNV